jgi:hypothetical protein
MLLWIRGAPILSSIFAASLLMGPMSVILRSDFLADPESAFHLSIVRAIVPANFVVLALTWVILYSLRHIELVLGSPRTITFGGFSLLIDIIVRSGLKALFRVPLPGSGPYAFLTTMLCLYCVHMPTVDGSLIAVNEKTLLAILLGLAVICDEVVALGSLLTGFCVFLFVGATGLVEV